MRKFLIPISLILIATFANAAGDIDVLSQPGNVGIRFTCGKYFPGADGAKVKEIGDVNNDGLADLAVSFPNVDVAASANGIVAIIYGSTMLQNNLDVCNFQDTSIGFRIKGPASTNFGTNVINMGDLNGDVVSDLAISAVGWLGNIGRVYVVYLPGLNGRRVEYAVSSLQSYTLTSITLNAKLGYFMAEAADYNGDGLKDVLIGSAATDTQAYILFGRSNGSGDVSTPKLTNTQGATLFTANSGDTTSFGTRQMQSCGDLNGDTIPDYVIPTTNNLYILYGLGKNPSTPISVSNANGEVIPISMTGSALTFPTTSTGTTVGGGIICADIDIDGRPDVILQLSDNNVHVLYGSMIKGLSNTGIDVKTTAQGMILTQVVSSSAFGMNIKKSTGWNGYGQDVLLITDAVKSVTYALYASTMFGTNANMNSFVIDNIKPTQGFRIYSSDTTNMAGSSLDASQDVNGDGINDLIVGEMVSWNSYVVYGQCNNPSMGCACPSGMKYSKGQCMNWGLSGGQKTGIIVGVIIGGLLLIALGVLILKKTSCGQSCFENYSKPQFGSNTHVPIPQTMATSA